MGGNVARSAFPASVANTVTREGVDALAVAGACRLAAYSRRGVALGIRQEGSVAGTGSGRLGIDTVTPPVAVIVTTRRARDITTGPRACLGVDTGVAVTPGGDSSSTLTHARERLSGCKRTHSLATTRSRAALESAPSMSAALYDKWGGFRRSILGSKDEI